MYTKQQSDLMASASSHHGSALDRMLSAWSSDPRVVGAQAAVDTEIAAVELEQRITKIRAR